MESATRIHITRKSVYFTRKSVESIIAANNAEHHGLKRTLGWASLLALGIGGIIGAGIFVLTGTVAANFAGPGVMVSFLLSGIACAFVALCYAELASLIPVSGSTYTYTYATLGEIFAWIIGWDLVLEYARRRRDGRRRLVRLFQQGSARLRRQPPARTHPRPFRRDGARRRDGAARAVQSARRRRSS